jgi:hypothetical protein
MRVLAALFLTMVMTVTIAAQTKATPAAPAKAEVVRVNIGYGCGFCGGFGYRSTLTTVSRLSIVRTMADAEDPKELPNRTVKRRITKHEWKTLVDSIDAVALRAVPQEARCRPCVDLPDAWVGVEYSDGSHLWVHYPPGMEPAPVKALRIPEVEIALQ